MPKCAIPECAAPTKAKIPGSPGRPPKYCDLHAWEHLSKAERKALAAQLKEARRIKPGDVLKAAKSTITRYIDEWDGRYWHVRDVDGKGRVESKLPKAYELAKWIKSNQARKVAA